MKIRSLGGFDEKTIAKDTIERIEPNNQAERNNGAQALSENIILGKTKKINCYKLTIIISSIYLPTPNSRKYMFYCD